MATNTDYKIPLPKAALFMLRLLACLWLIFLTDALLGGWLTQMLGLVPRTMRGLLGIAFAPLLHGSLYHMMANSVPFFVLGLLIYWRDPFLFLITTLVIAIGSGLAVWIFARQGVHIGVSGIIFGYFGFLASNGWVEKDWRALLVSVFVIIAYGGMIFGILPVSTYISWEAHLFGFIAGILAGRNRKAMMVENT
ncbi:MAG: rhomboid family intramembrane serine protease [Mariprofundales bacterium]